MMQRPTNRRGKRPAARMMPPAEMTRQQALEAPVEPAEDVRPEETRLPYRACVSATDQLIPAGEAVSWSQPGWPWQTSLPLEGTQNLLLLNLTFVSETGGPVQWTLRAGDHAVSVLKCQTTAAEPVTLMLNTRLSAEAESSVMLCNDSEMGVVIERATLNILTL